MEASPRAEEPFPTPPPYFLPDDCKTGQSLRIYHIHSPFSPPPPPPSFSMSPGEGGSYQNHLPVPVSVQPPTTPRLKFVSHEVELHRSPALTTCPSCQSQVTSQVDYRAGTQAWLLCALLLLCGLVLGCCLIPLFLDHFKDAYHSCPQCHRVLHVHRRRCCERD